MDALFAGSPRALALARRVRGAVERMGGVEAAVTKSQVALRAAGGGGFCWLWRPPKGVRGVPDDGIVVSFGLRHRVESPRIKQVVEPRLGRFIHHLVVMEPRACDEQLLGWLAMALDEARAAARP